MRRIKYLEDLHDLDEAESKTTLHTSSFPNNIQKFKKISIKKVKDSEQLILNDKMNSKYSKIIQKLKYISDQMDDDFKHLENDTYTDNSSWENDNGINKVDNHNSKESNKTIEENIKSPMVQILPIVHMKRNERNYNLEFVSFIYAYATI